VIRAFFGDRLYFKFSPEQFFPHSSEKVEQIIAQREARERRERLVEQGGVWLQQVLKGQQTAPPGEAREIIRILKDYCLFEKESPDHQLARDMLKKVGSGAPSTVFTFLVTIGLWHPDENLDLLGHNISTELPPPVAQHAAVLCRRPPPLHSGRRDFRELEAMTIDGPATLDFDDALSIDAQGDHFRLGIHIADASDFIA